MKSSLFVVVTVLFVTALPMLAETTGNEVLSNCQAAVQFSDNNGAPVGEHFDSGWCIGWVTGALQFTKLNNEWTTLIKEKPTPLQFCVAASGVPVIQAVRVVVKYLKEHPEQLTEDGMGLTIAALKNSFPCK